MTDEAMAVVQEHMVGDANKTLARVLDQLDAAKEAASSVDNEALFGEMGPNFMQFSDALREVESNLTKSVLTLILAKATMQMVGDESDE